MPFYYNKQVFNDLDNRPKCLVTLDIKTFDPVVPLTDKEMYMLNCNIGAFLTYGRVTGINAFLQGSVSTTTVFFDNYYPDIAEAEYFGFDLTPYLLPAITLCNELKYNLQGSTDEVIVDNVYINPCTILAVKNIDDDGKTLVTMKGGSVLIECNFESFLSLLPDAH